MKLVPIRLPHCLLPLALAGALWLPTTNVADAQSEWVRPSPGGKLAYKSLPGGDRIIDFSHAGYGGGGHRLVLASRGSGRG